MADGAEDLGASEHLGTRITLAVVTRDRADVLERNLLDGLRAVASSGVPVVVVDQSEDSRTERLVADIDGVRYLRSGPGLSTGRNVALKAVRTPLVAFTDDDVSIDPSWLHAVVRAFDDGPRAGAVCGRAFAPGGGLLPGGPQGEHDDPRRAFTLGSGFNLSLRMEALETVGGFDEDLGAGGRYSASEDSDILYRLLKSGWTVSCRDDVTVVHDDWRTKRQELRLHFGYGVGTGAQTAKHVRDGDRAALATGAQRLVDQVQRVARSARRGNLRTAVIEAGFVPGMLAGFARRLLDRSAVTASRPPGR